jgi:hypothetical protein
MCIGFGMRNGAKAEALLRTDRSDEIRERKSGNSLPLRRVSKHCCGGWCIKRVLKRVNNLSGMKTFQHV